ncbi:probable pre-mRNA-splicing factor ATP-dependent RNA helicase DEAH5 [Tanacetum coccineum]
MMTSELKDDLKYQYLISKVCVELEPHGFPFKRVLAEFIVNLGRQCDNIEDFKRKLKQHNDNDMHANLVRKLFTIIHACNTLPPKHWRIYANESQPSCSMEHDHTEGVEKAPSFGERSKLRLLEHRQNLPIYKLKEELVQAVHDNQVLLVIGETGSGKTTQVTQYLAEAGYTTRGMIACTQPRRVAARSTAKRVAKEFGCRLGEEVGYAISFEDCTRLETVINYMADGTLLMEILIDENLSQHSNYFSRVAHFQNPETFPVELYYTKQPECDYLEAALKTVMQIHLTEPEGDILVFLTGQEEIIYACRCLVEQMKKLGKNVPQLIVLPVYSALPSEMQSKILKPTPSGERKVVVATNIAEASMTIDGIIYVIDSGFCKQNVYNQKLGLESLVVTPISQASAKLRAGRAGRTGPGKCFRLYTNFTYNEMSPTSIPEIQRINLRMTILTLKAMGINDLFAFDFMDPPSPQALISAMQQLHSLRALDEEGLITKLGRLMAEFPLEPPLSKMLLASVDLGCSEEILTIIAMIQTGNIFYRPRERQAEADKKKSKFFQPEGDHLTLLAVYNSWKENKFSAQWCYENFVQVRSLTRARDVRQQLLPIMARYKLDVVSAGNNYTKIRKAITYGFFFHAARKDPQEGYRTIVDNQPVYMHPDSVLFHRQPDWIIYHELVMTTKEYMREDPIWGCDSFGFWMGWRNRAVRGNLTMVLLLSWISSRGFIAGQADLKAASCKVIKHEKACIENQQVFIPFAFDTFGFLAPDAVELLSRVQHVMFNVILGSFPPLSTPVTTTADNAPGKSLYTNVTSKPSGKKLNICTLFTPGAYRSMFSASTCLFSIQFSSMDGLDAMLENGPWFIWNNPLILKKWHPDENLLKEDVSTVPIWVKLHGVPVTNFSDDGLSAIATKLVMIELRADMELKENIVVAMPNITRDGHYKWKPPRLLDNNRNLLVPTSTMESDSKVEVVFDETANLRIPTSGKDRRDNGYDTNSLLEQWRDSYPDNDDYDLYDDDIYENHDLSEHLQSICDDLVITVRDRKKK